MHTSAEEDSTLVHRAKSSARNDANGKQLAKAKDKGNVGVKDQNPLLVSLVGKDHDGSAGDVSAGSAAKVVSKDTDGGVFGSYLAQALVFFAIFSASIGAALPAAGFFIFVSKLVKVSKLPADGSLTPFFSLCLIELSGQLLSLTELVR